MKKTTLNLALIFLSLGAYAEDTSDFICSKEWFPGTDEEATMPSSTPDDTKKDGSKKNKNTKPNQQNVPKPKVNEGNNPSMLSPKSEKSVFPEDGQ